MKKFRQRSVIYDDKNTHERTLGEINLEGGKNSLAAIPNSVKATVPVVSGNAIAGFRGPMRNIIVEDPPEVYLSEVRLPKAKKKHRVEKD
jgi:hypothetical protein